MLIYYKKSAKKYKINFNSFFYLKLNFIFFGRNLIINKHFAIQKFIFILFNYYNYLSTLA